MIPHVLSQAPATTARTMPLQAGTAPAPRPSEPGAAFTLVAEDPERDARGSGDGSDSLAFAPDLPAALAATTPAASGETLATVGATLPHHWQGAPPGPAGVVDGQAAPEQTGPAGSATEAATAPAIPADTAPLPETKVLATSKADAQAPPRPDGARTDGRTATLAPAQGAQPDVGSVDTPASGPDPRTTAAATTAPDPRPTPTFAVAAAAATVGSRPRVAVPQSDGASRLSGTRAAAPATGIDGTAEDVTEPKGRATDGDARAKGTLDGLAPPLPGTASAPTSEAAFASSDRIASDDPAVSAQERETMRADPGRIDPMRPDPTRTELPRTVGTQLVEAIRHGPSGSTDVALNPEELGRVRLSLTAQDGILHVAVIAERPETQDLLRRNIGMLQSDFRALGYTDIAFDFGPSGDRSHGSARPAVMAPAIIDAPDNAMAAPGAPPVAQARADAPSTRLDLRL